MSQSFKVWDELNSSEEHAETVEAYDARDAARRYADDDTDGRIDGIYAKGQPISVRSADGALSRFYVTVEYEPVFRATPRADETREVTNG